MPRLSRSDQEYVQEFVTVVGETIEEHASAETSLTVLHRACTEHARAQGSEFIPISNFVRLMEATGYRRVYNRYGRRFAGLRLKDPEMHHLSWHWD